MGRRSKEVWESVRSYDYYYKRLLELALSRFEYENLPEDGIGIDTRYLELTLFKNGVAVLFQDEVMGHLALPVLLSGDFDVYQRPTNRRAYATNGYQKRLTEKDSVLIYNNYTRSGSQKDIENFAKRLYNLDMTIDLNTNAQKTPILVACDENERLTMENLYNQYSGNRPFIFGKKSLSTQPLSVLKTDAPYLADKLWELKTNIWNEALTYLGISNVSINKRERLVTDEVTRSLGGVLASQYSGLAMREMAVAAYNKMTGLNIKVKMRDALDTTLEQETQEQEVAE